MALLKSKGRQESMATLDNRQKVLSIHQLIETQAYRTPNAIAVIFNDKAVSYQELNEQSNRLADYLISKGIQPKTLIGISLKRSIEMITSILAVLKAGCAYVPIDPTYPKERISFMLTDSNIPVLLTQKSVLEELPKLSTQVICLDTDWQYIEIHSPKKPLTIINPDNLAYVLYTSGSTGTPKGVMIKHESLLNAYQGWETVYELEQNKDSHLQMASFSFDVFTGDLVRALCSGGKLVLCPNEILLDPSKLYQLILAEKITCAEFVPTVLRRLIDYLELTKNSLNFMRILICGSDNWSIHEYRKFQNFCDLKTRVINSYGLTEATIDSTYFEDKQSIEEHFLEDRTVPIGKPFPNTEIYVLDENMTSVKSGAVGEIYIGGLGLALGYLNNPQLTSEKFIKHPFAQHPDARLYKTGDTGRYLEDGNIEFLGRVDNQVKVRGMRIELSDIENSLSCHDAVKESLVTVCEDDSHHKRLVAYIVGHQDNNMPSARELRNFLQKRLPHYMIPSVFIKLDSLPMTPNGKLDRQALKSIKPLSFNDAPTEPSSPIEKQLAVIWKKVLKINEVGIFDHFFDDLGGDSLTLAKLLCAIEDTFSLKIGLNEISNYLTIAELASFISNTNA